MEEMHDVIIGMDAINAVRAQIQNRFARRQELHEKLIAIDGEIAGLREAEHQIEKAKGYNVAFAL